MATSIDFVALALNLSGADFTIVAQEVICAYPNSDIYASAPRYLYYCSLFLAFLTLRYRWLSNIFLGAAAAYAASATIHAFIITSSPVKLQPPTPVSIPFVAPQSNLTSILESIATNTTTLSIQPDAVELDLDSITAVVISAYLVGLPLQVWSRTMSSSNITHYIIVFWNILMLAGTICALIAWPNADLAAPQYRFCFASVLDPDSMTSPGWDTSMWKGSWNSTVWNVFDNFESVWQQMSSNCFYPCFNTSQVIRQSTSLKAVVFTPQTKFAKLHVAARRNDDDYFQELVYLAIVLFSVAQFFLYLVSRLRLGSKSLPETIHRPQHLWGRRKLVLEEIREESSRAWGFIKSICRSCVQSTKKHSHSLQHRTSAQPTVRTNDMSLCVLLGGSLLSTSRLLITILALITLVASLTLFPVCVVAFISWIEWYIRNDGPSNESISQVGQWSPLVSVAVVLIARLLYKLRWRVASEEEVNSEIRNLELQARKLRGKLEERKAT